LLVNEVIWAALGHNPISGEYTQVPAKIIVVLDNPSKVDDVFLREMRKWYNLKPEQCHKRGKPYITQITFENGSTVDFFFHLQEEMAAESVEWTHLFFDEPASRRLYVALKRGGRTKGHLGRILFIGTPIAASWLRRDVYEPWAKGERPNTECFRFGTDVNKGNLAEGYLEEFSRVLTEREKRIRLHGEFFDLDGLALAHLFDRKTHVVPPVRWPDNLPVVISIDPHLRKPHTALMLGVTRDDHLLALKELTFKGTPSAFALELKKFVKGYKVVDYVCDSMGSGDLTGGDGIMSFIGVLRKHGIRVRPTTFDEKRDEGWLQNIQEALALPFEADQMGSKEPLLKICSNCTGLISDIESVEYQKHKDLEEYKPKLAIEAKDHLSCLKYAMAARPHFNKGYERVIRSNHINPTRRQKWRNNA
jgi:hypothetical protein